MATFKDMEDGLKTFIIQEQSDAHNRSTLNTAKYNNIKITMDMQKNPIPHVTIRISISEGTFALADFSKMNGEERLVHKWFGRYGVKDKLPELWASAEKNSTTDNKDDKKEN